MTAAKISITVDEDLVIWARRAAKTQRASLSAFVADALAQQRQHQARQKYLKKVLAGVPPDELERKIAQAHRDLLGDSDATE